MQTMIAYPKKKGKIPQRQWRGNGRARGRTAAQGGKGGEEDEEEGAEGDSW
jgi:hypothetical protein